MVISNLSTICCQIGSVAGGRGNNFAGTIALLTRQSQVNRIGIDTVKIRSLGTVSSALQNKRNTLRTPQYPRNEQHMSRGHFWVPLRESIPHMAVASQLEMHVVMFELPQL